jgi:Glycosyltransferase
VDRAVAAAPRAGTDGPFTVISVGRLESVKDPLALLEAFGRAFGQDGDARLVFIGAGKLEETLQARTDHLGLGDRVDLTGLIPRDDVFVSYAEADVFVSTSHGEGLPVAVLEAMAAGCPVILSDIPPHREVAEDAEFIPLVAPGDLEGFAREIRRYEEMPPEERRAIGRRCGLTCWSGSRSRSCTRPPRSCIEGPVVASGREDAMIVEFIGCSGAGKTTLADAIERIGGPRSTISGTGLIVDHPGVRWISDPTAVNLVADVISFPPFLRALGRQKDFVTFAFDRLQRHAPSPFARYNYMLNVVRKLGVNEMARRAAGGRPS